MILKIFNSQANSAVTNINGAYNDHQTHRTYIAHAQIHVNVTVQSVIEREDILRHIREAHSIPPSVAAQPMSPVVSRSDASQTAVVPSDVDHCYVSATRSIIEIRLMIDIVRMMINHPTLCSSSSLSETLAALERVLHMTELSVRAYHHSPFSESFSRAVAIEVDDCRQLLQELLSHLSDYRRILSATVLYFIRKYVWRRFGQSVVVDTLDLQLQKSHRSFAACLLALGR